MPRGLGSCVPPWLVPRLPPALLPWAIRASFVHPDELGRGRLTHVGWALLLGIPVAALSPLLTYALKPFFQWWLGVVSPGRLMKLSDMDHPLLAELAAEAPGTCGRCADAVRHLGAAAQ